MLTAEHHLHNHMSAPALLQLRTNKRTRLLRAGVNKSSSQLMRFLSLCIDFPRYTTCVSVCVCCFGLLWTHLFVYLLQDSDPERDEQKKAAAETRVLCVLELWQPGFSKSLTAHSKLFLTSTGAQINARIVFHTNTGENALRSCHKRQSLTGWERKYSSETKITFAFLHSNCGWWWLM